MSAKECTSCKDGKIEAGLFINDADVGKDCLSCEGTGWDTNYTDEICCPFCGHETSESYELNSNDGETDCSECGKVFLYQRNITVEYTTYIGPDCIRDKTKHQWKPIGLTYTAERDGKTYVRCKPCGKYSWEVLA